MLTFKGLHQHVLDQLKACGLGPQSTLIVGLSGGPDSVALLHLLQRCQRTLGYQIIAAHLDHEWRTNSQADATFCQELTQEWGITIVVMKASELTIQPKINGSKEALGRALRQQFFQEIAQKYTAPKIILGHHLNDQLETFLIRLIRGSSLSGLGGMQSVSGMYLRPLLQITKAQILSYLTEHNLEYVIDPTNYSDLFLRNRIRKVIPNLQAIDHRLEQNFDRTLTQIQQANQFIARQTKIALEQVSLNSQINLNLFFALDPFLQNQVLLAWLYQHKVQFTPSESLVTEIFKFLNSHQGGSHQIHPTWSLEKKQQQVAIYKKA